MTVGDLRNMWDVRHVKQWIEKSLHPMYISDVLRLKVMHCYDKVIYMYSLYTDGDVIALKQRSCPHGWQNRIHGCRSGSLTNIDSSRWPKPNA